MTRLSRVVGGWSMNSLLVSTDAGSNDATLQLAIAAYLAR
jgi:hypothetical protein